MWILSDFEMTIKSEMAAVLSDSKFEKNASFSLYSRFTVAEWLTHSPATL